MTMKVEKGYQFETKSNFLEILSGNKEIWDLFTKREEYNASLLDLHGRFPSYLSKSCDVFKPKVSELLMAKGLSIEYPDNQDFGICLTHDIDYIRFSDARFAYEYFQSLKQGNIRNALKMPLYLVNPRKNPLWNFEEIVDLEESHNAKSSFYFLTAEQDLGCAPNYQIDELEWEIGHILDKGWDIGLHSGYYSYADLEELKREKRKLESVASKRVRGCRNHFLRFKVPDTWKILKQAGFEYDATFGYADLAGFRNGMCYPFTPFDLNTGNSIDILEIPLTIMDCTLFDYMKLDFEGAWTITKQILDNAKRARGIVTVLWHNTHMVGDFLRFYKKILEYGSVEKAWMTGCEEIGDWWKKLDINL